MHWSGDSRGGGQKTPNLKLGDASKRGEACGFAGKLRLICFRARFVLCNILTLTFHWDEV